jgi:hypothetical protein
MMLAVAIVYALSFVPTGPVRRVTVPPAHVRRCEYSAQVNYCVVRGTAAGPVVRTVRQVRHTK